MPAISWTITRGGGDTRTLADWQIKSARRALVNLGRDTLMLGFGGSDLLGNSPFDYGETLRLDRLVDGVATTVFRGRVSSRTRGAYGSAEGLSIEVSGPWWYLENLIFMQSLPYVTDTEQNPAPIAPATDVVSSQFPTVKKTSSTIVVSQDETGMTVDSKTQLLNAVNYAIAKGAPIALGVIDDGIAIPRDAIQDATCAEVILKSLRWTPDQSIFFDYSVNPPTLNVRTRANRAAFQINIADATTSEVEINPRDDLAVAGVTLNYLRRNSRQNFEFQTLDKDSAGPSPEGIGALVLTLELYGSYLVANPDPRAAGTYVVIAAEPVPAGLAAALYAAYSVVHYEGRIVTAEDECSGAAWISRKLSIANGVPDWSTAGMIIQRATEDLFSGRTELSVGPPRQLGAQDLLGLVRKGKTQPPTLGDSFGPTTPKTPDINPGTSDRRVNAPNGTITLNVFRGVNVGGPGFYGAWVGDVANVYITEGGIAHQLKARDLQVRIVTEYFGAKFVRVDKYISDPAANMEAMCRNDELIPQGAKPSYIVLTYTNPVTVT